MGSMSIWHWIIVIAVVLLLFGRGKISDLMGDVAQGIKAFKKGMSEDDKTAEKAPEPMKTIDNAPPSPQAAAPQPTDASRKAV
jgi:sec-independent protein translocase protein TatA